MEIIPLKNKFQPDLIINIDINDYASELMIIR